MSRRPSKGSWASPRTLASLTGILGVSTIALWAMGRVWWCECGEPDLWSWHIWSRHNSQHVIDPYTVTHIVHGVLFYGLLRVLLGKRLARLRVILAIGAEAAWEIAENTSWLIDRYREATISLDYYGDSVINSLADILACLAGYALAAAIPVWLSVAGVVISEVVLLIWIRDSLLLNIVMLIRPIEAIKTWQTGGQ